MHVQPRVVRHRLVWIATPRVPAQESPEPRAVIPRPQVHQPRPVPQLAGEAVDGRACARRGERIAEWLVRSGEPDTDAGIHELPHRTECIAEMVLPAARLLLPDPAVAIEVRVRAVGKDLRQTSGDIERVVRRRPRDGLPKAIAQPVVREPVGERPPRRGSQAAVRPASAARRGWRRRRRRSSYRRGSSR